MAALRSVRRLQQVLLVPRISATAVRAESGGKGSPHKENSKTLVSFPVKVSCFQQAATGEARNEPLRAVTAPLLDGGGSGGQSETQLGQEVSHGSTQSVDGMSQKDDSSSSSSSDSSSDSESEKDDEPVTDLQAKGKSSGGHQTLATAVLKSSSSSGHMSLKKESPVSQEQKDRTRMRGENAGDPVETTEQQSLHTAPRPTKMTRPDANNKEIPHRRVPTEKASSTAAVDSGEILITSAEIPAGAMESGETQILSSSSSEEIPAGETQILSSSSSEEIPAGETQILSSSSSEEIPAGETRILSSSSSEEIPAGETRILSSSSSEEIPAGETQILSSSEEIPAGETRILSSSSSEEIPAGETQILSSSEEIPAGETRILSSSSSEEIPAGETRILSSSISEEIPAGETQILSSSSSEEIPAGETRILSSSISEEIPAGETRILSSSISEEIPAGETRILLSSEEIPAGETQILLSSEEIPAGETQILLSSEEIPAEVHGSCSPPEPRVAPQEPFDNTKYQNLQHFTYTPFTFVDVDVELAKYRLPQPSSGRPSPRQ